MQDDALQLDENVIRLLLRFIVSKVIVYSNTHPADGAVLFLCDCLGS